MKTTMTQKQALAIARQHVGPVTRNAKITYTVKAPKNPHKPDGAKVNIIEDDYWTALEYSTVQRAKIACNLLGIKNPDFEYGSDGRTTESLVSAAARNAKG